MLKRFTAIIFSLVFVASVATVALAQDAGAEGTPAVAADADNPQTQPKVEEKIEPAKESITEDTNENENTEATKVEKVDKVDEPVKKIVAKIYTKDGKNFVNQSVKFKLKSSDNVELDRVEYKLDGGEIVKYSEPFSIEKEGKHSVSYYGVDKSGNSEDAKLLNVIVDNTAPVVVVTTTAPIKAIGGKNFISSNVSFSIATLDNLSGVDKLVCSIGEKSFDYSGVFSIDATGDITLKIKSIDNVLNTSEAFTVNIADEAGKSTVTKVDSELKLVVDNEAPVVSIKADKEYVKSEKKNLIAKDTAFTISAEDKGAGVSKIYVKLDGNGKFVEYLEPIKFVKNGAHQIEYKAVDKLGNTSKVSSLKVVVDAVAPTTAIEMVD